VRPIKLLFGFHGRIGRAPFLAAIAGTLIAYSACVAASWSLLPVLAVPAASRGINAGFILNGIWITLAVLTLWVLLAVFWKRLAAVGYSGWPVLLAAAPLIAVAVNNDWLFLWSRSHIWTPTVDFVLAAAGLIPLAWLTVKCVVSKDVSL
jgi:uncharacterized membrane protein YhaH (DUF805 family)